MGTWGTLGLVASRAPEPTAEVRPEAPGTTNLGAVRCVLGIEPCHGRPRSVRLSSKVEVDPGSSVSSEVISRVVHARHPALLHCFESTRVPSGEVSVRFSILADGSVEAATISVAPTGAEPKAGCVAATWSN